MMRHKSGSPQQSCLKYKLLNIVSIKSTLRRDQGTNVDIIRIALGMFANVDDINCASFEHAYGPATDLPKMLRSLASPDRAEWESALHAAYGNIFHQGTRYSATPKAIPFLIEIAARPETKHRSQIMSLLVHCVAGYFGPAQGPNVGSGTIWGERARPMTDYGETAQLLGLRTCRRTRRADVFETTLWRNNGRASACSLGARRTLALCRNLRRLADARSGGLYLELGDYEQAALRLKQAETKEATTHALWPQTLFQLGIAYYNTRQLEAAYAAFSRAEPVVTAANREKTRQNRIAMLQELERFDEALAIEMMEPPQGAIGFYNLGLAQVKAGKLRECIASIQTALSLNSTHANSHYTIACAYAMLGEVENALESIGAALKINPRLASDIASDSDFESIKDHPRFIELTNIGS